MSPTPGDGEADPPTRIGSYRIERRLGAGGMGAVYRAYDEALERPVAVKRLLPGAVDPKRALRFRREARLAARLNHPSIVHIYEIVETEAGDWIVMELVEGKTLDRMLRDAQLDLTSAVRLAREIAQGLSEAHAQGIVHRDLKASNVMVTAAGRAKILDFGLAKSYGDDSEQGISAAGTVVGTYHAMSPEQAQGLAVDHRSDLFSFGSLLYEMLTGLSPFYAATPVETLARVCAYEPESIRVLQPAVPQELAELTHRLISKSPAERPQNGGDVVALLERIERSGPSGRIPRAATGDGVATSDTTRAGIRAPGAARSASPPPLTSSERRQMTVLCCEMVDAARPGTDSPQPLDPERLYDLMLQLRPLAHGVAQRYEGTLGSVVGHRLLVYFGFPQAHEDDARRAVRAALDLVSEAGEPLAGSSRERVRTAVRVGIHTGPAVVSTSPNNPEPVVLGTTLDIALRLQACAAAGSVVISPATRSLVLRAFATEPLAPLPPPAGATEPLVPYRVRTQTDSGEEAAFDLAPLVGRERELDLLVSRWQQARDGTGQAVLLSGEPGIGKSRLLRALRERVNEGSAAGAVRWLSLQATPYTQNTPLDPVVSLLRRALALEPGGSTREQLDALLRAFSLGEALPLFASLLELPLAGAAAGPALPPERQREDTLEALVALLVEMAQREPVVLLVEDLHWLDATTVAWLDRLIDQAASAPLLLVMTIRPNTLELPWGSRARVTQISLGALSGEETARLVGLLSGDHALRADVQKHIVAKTDGVPLFVEELTRSVLEGGESGDWRDLPTTLRDSLTARLGRLGTAKEVAQLASVIGRAFPLKLLAAVASHGEDTLERELRRLVQSGLVHRRGFGAQTRYSFKHALVRDAAYDSLLRRERQQVHLRIAMAMDEERRGGGEGTPSEEIAFHYMAGEEFDRAFACWLEAGQLAMGRSAHAEAIGHLRHGLEALEAQAPSPERDLREISLRSVLAVSLGVVQGQSAPGVEAVYERILALTGQMGKVPQPIYFGLWNFYASRGKLHEAREMAQQRLDYGEASDDAESLFVGQYTRSAADLFLGQPAAAREGFERLLSIYPREGLANQAIAYDIGIVALSLLGDALWLLGLPDAAQRKADEAIELGRRSSPFTQSVALVNRLILATSMRDAATSRQRAEELIALSAEHSYQYWTVHWRISLALAGITAGTPAEEIDRALAEASSSIAMMRTAFGSNLQCSRFLAWTVAACLEHGRAPLARPLLDEALLLVEHDGERYWEADLRRLQGLLLLAQGAPAGQAEACFQQALAVARAQGARIFELRAAVDLCRFWRDLGRTEEARALLGPLHASFAEGEDTPDLRTARELLSLLESPRG